jgi:hypothetical protein
LRAGMRLPLDLDARLKAVSRRARSPLFLPRPEVQRTGFRGFLLVPTSAYHVEELWPLAVELRAALRDVTFITTRAAPERVREALAACAGHQERLYAWPRLFPLLPAFEAVVVMNDWGPTRRLVKLAAERGVPSFAKVEGAQDFLDADTRRDRRPYRHSDVVLAQGRNDAAHLSRGRTMIVGSTRLEKLWHAPERTMWNNKPLAVINSNFTYRVLDDERLLWLDAALDACRRAGLAAVISQHPGEDSLPPAYPVIRTAMCRLLECEADVLISRFSTVPFEAMARGVPVVYFKPPSETVATFDSPGEAFRIVTGTEELAAAIEEAVTWRGTYRQRCAPFFQQQVDIDEGCRSEQRASRILRELVPGPPSFRRSSPAR